MNKIVTMLLFAGMVVGCVSSISQPEQTISKFNPAPVQPAPDPIVRTDPFLNDEIWVHWFQLGGTLETHRKSCKTLSGTWNYEREWCEVPTIPNFGVPSVVYFDWANPENPEIAQCTSRITFVYIDANRTFLNTWLEYCYGDFGEPFIKDPNDKGGWVWKFNNALLGVVKVEDPFVGFGAWYSLCSFDVPRGPTLRSTTGSR